ncbi:hypothetical protein IWW34DRAFT_745995 [Fusarium oxysporum f. sp. albedinis]|nr:hypothetical protein IWW34DRAFT_745995 [Fusarium oxysporum f. sp. albedinis]KAJ0139096.1 Uncharacterized protein HZ326_17954 [Fusarium oxysporum f. sp. albedinis]KAK2473090.1 hypothetical protein H9L39_15265 [Fusarium oxysporum f. sp. albedinis]
MAPKSIVCLILSCALLGGYASMGTSYRHGFFDAVRDCITNAKSPDGSSLCPLDMSDSISRKLTGYQAVDEPVMLLLEFFAQGLKKHPESKGMDLEALLAFVYLAAQFCGAWYLIALEGLRFGNRGTILSWTGSFGIVFQSVTITIIAPIYLTLQLLLSPTIPQQAYLLADPCDLSLLPISTVISYIVPTIGLCLPLIFDVSREAKFIAVALWQPFPLYQTAIQRVSRLVCWSRRGKANNTAHIDPRACRKAMNRAYRFITTLAVGVHLAVFGTILASSMDLTDNVSGRHILALTSLTNPPTLALLSPPVSAMQSREIVVSFLRWDVYCTCLAMAIWTGYQLYSAQRAPSRVVICFNTIWWTILGGPIYPALRHLWERDAMVLDRMELFSSSLKIE